MDLAEKVRKRRNELGWSQEELALKMGYKSRVSVNKIECGRPVSQKIIYRLSQAPTLKAARSNRAWHANMKTPENTRKCRVFRGFCYVGEWECGCYSLLSFAHKRLELLHISRRV